MIAFTGCSGDYCWSAVVLVLCAYCFQLSVIKSFDVRTLTQLQQIRYCYKSYRHQRLLAFNFIPFDYEIFDINLIRGKIIACSWASFNSNQQFVYSGVCFCGFDLCIEKWSNQKYEVFYWNVYQLKFSLSVFIGDNGVSKPNFKFRSGRINVLEVTILAVDWKNSVNSIAWKPLFHSKHSRSCQCHRMLNSSWSGAFLPLLQWYSTVKHVPLTIVMHGCHWLCYSMFRFCLKHGRSCYITVSYSP